MPNFHAGHGGKVTAGTNDLAILTWSLPRHAKLAEITNSGSGGIEQWFKLIKGGTFQFKAIWDSTLIPEVDAGMDVGDSVTLKFYLGDSTKFYQFVGLIEHVSSQVDNQNGVVIYDADGKINSAVTLPLT